MDKHLYFDMKQKPDLLMQAYRGNVLTMKIRIPQVYLFTTLLEKQRIKVVCFVSRVFFFSFPRLRCTMNNLKVPG